MNNSAIQCCDCQCSCHDNRVLRGWQAISEWAHKVNLPIGRSPSQLRRYAQNMGFTIWVNRYGRICLFPRHGMDWFINFKSRNDWWPNGRPGRKGRAWEELTRKGGFGVSCFEIDVLNLEVDDEVGETVHRVRHSVPPQFKIT